ncbi:hypothetical protein [Arthrobacter sp. ov118]|uniref:hypothetical protein n=1 Tax=Arthrobacter sp. ov118 TaxID=1761747 RepID=UPI000B864EC2|nr:hypothetical protein [Arthrobacter sp. ov118]
MTQLTEALYRHLDSPNPIFDAHTLFELATEELQDRRDGQPVAPITGSPGGHAPAAEEVSRV